MTENEIKEKLKNEPCPVCGNSNETCICTPKEKERRERMKHQLMQHLFNMDPAEREALQKRMQERKKR